MEEPVASPTLVRDLPALTSALRWSIVSGQLSPNERLIETEVATQYGVNRNMVREALVELAKEGLLERHPNRGARVRMLSTDEAVEITEVRLAVEGICAAKAAERATDEEIQNLRSTVKAMSEAVVAGDVVRHQELLHEFHRQIRELSRHATAIAIAEQLRNQVIRHLFREALIPGRLPFVVRELEAVVDAIERRDPSAAESAMRDHQHAAVSSMRTIGDGALFLQQ